MNYHNCTTDVSRRWYGRRKPQGPKNVMLPQDFNSRPSRRIDTAILEVLKDQGLDIDIRVTTCRISFA